MTVKRKRRTPSAVGFKKVPTPKVTKEESVAELFSPVPKDFSFLGEVKVKDFEGRLTKVTNSSYPQCCGAQIIHGFSNLLSMDQTQRAAVIAAQVAYAETSRIGMVMAIINNYQKQLGFDKAFEANGFKMVSCTSNPNHSDTTTIYLYTKMIGNKRFDEIGKEKRFAS